MKAILVFNLPDDMAEYKTASNAERYESALCHIDNHLRSTIKYGHSYHTVEELAEYVRQLIPFEIWED